MDLASQVASMEIQSHFKWFRLLFSYLERRTLTSKTMHPSPLGILPQFLAIVFFPKIRRYEVFQTDQWSETYGFKVASLLKGFMPGKQSYAGR
jgi:hypothetical protein